MNRKKRKLNYIREKNRLRMGGVVRDCFHVPTSLLKDNDFIQESILDNAEQTCIVLKSYFKMDCGLSKVEQGLSGNNFVKHLTTIKLTFKAKYYL